MSTRSGPYEVDVHGQTWTYEHDFVHSDLLAWGDDVFRIWAPDEDWALEIRLHAFKEFAREDDPLPIELVDDIQGRFDLPNSFAIKHAELRKQGFECPHCKPAEGV